MGDLTYGEKSIIIDESVKPYHEATLERFIAYAKDKFGVDLIPKKSENPDTVENLFHVMREPTPEEYAAMDKLIKNMSYDTGETFEGTSEAFMLGVARGLDLSAEIAHKYCDKENRDANL